MPKIDLTDAAMVHGTRYPAPFDAPVKGRSTLKLSEVVGLTAFGVNLVQLPPGTWSSQRHWHSDEDEFAFVAHGEVVLVTDGGEVTLKAGESAGFKAGIRDGHHFQNRSAHDALLLVVGSRSAADHCEFSDADLKVEKQGDALVWKHRDGTPY